MIYRGGLDGLPSYRIMARQAKMVCNGESLDGEGTIYYRERPELDKIDKFDVWVLLWELLP
jgi:hypothetical protein